MIGLLRIRYVDGTEFPAPITPSVSVEFERHFAEPDRNFRPSIVDIATTQKTEWLYYLGYLAARRLWKNGEHPGAFKPTFDDWLDQLEDIELEDEAPLDEPTSSSTSS